MDVLKVDSKVVRKDAVMVVQTDERMVEKKADPSVGVTVAWKAVH